MSEQKKIIVHIGPHKTGSTAIQKCLLSNQVSLFDSGVCFFHNDISKNAAAALCKDDYEKASNFKDGCWDVAYERSGSEGRLARPRFMR